MRDLNHLHCIFDEHERPKFEDSLLYSTPVCDQLEIRPYRHKMSDTEFKTISRRTAKSDGRLSEPLPQP